MTAIRWIFAPARILALAILVTPVFGLIAAPAMDRGEDGSARLTVFPAALVALDHLALECLRNSLSLAGSITAFSLVAGLALAAVAGRGDRRFSRLRPFLASAPMAVPPFVAAWGWHLAVLWAAGRWPEWLGHDAGLLAAWFPMLAAYSVWGGALVASRAGGDLRRIDPEWTRAGRLAGSGRLALTYRLTWPLIRPGVARALAAIFTITLIEPSVPWMLGLHRTLGAQALAESFHDEASPRLGVLVVTAAVLAWVVRAILLRRGGEDVLADLPEHPLRPIPGRVGRLAGWMMTVGWSALGVVPLVFLVRQSRGATSQGIAWLGDFAPGGEMLRPLIVSLTLGAIASTFGLLLSGRPGGPPRRGWAAGLLGSCSPMALSVGALAIPGFLELATRRLRDGSASSLDGPIARIGGWLDPLASPGLALALVTSALTFPLIAALIGAGGLPSPDTPSRLDAARLLGIPARAARRAAGAPRLRKIWLAGVLLSSTTPAAGLLLAPTTEARPLASAFVLLIDRPGQSPRVAAIALILTTFNALGLLAAGRAGRRPLAESSLA